MDADEGLYHATPQVRGKIAHQSVDNTTGNSCKEELLSLPVCSNKYKLYGKIDLLRVDKKLLIERKYKSTQLYKGQIYQLWAQYYCLLEMGYAIEYLAFYINKKNDRYCASYKIR